MRVPAFHFVLAFCLWFGMSGGTAYAEPITPRLRITSGVASVDWADGIDAFWRLTAAGPGFSLVLFENLALSGFGFSLTPPIDASYGWVSNPENTSGFVQVGSRRFDMSSGVKINLAFTSPVVTTPPPRPSDPGQLLSFSAPHTMAGTISGLVSADGEFSYVIEGKGISFYDGFVTDDNFLLVLFQSHVFQDSAPIPEPGTMVLLSATGIIGILGRRSRVRNAIQR